MQMQLRTYCFLLAFLAMGKLFGQDMQFSQPYSNPLYLNPAFTGTAQATRVVLNYRNQWPGIGHEYKAFAASADLAIDEINSGVGISVIKDIAGENNLSNTMASLYYAKQIRISRKANLSFGVKGSFGQRAIHDGNLLFADQIIRESNTSLSQPDLMTATDYADFSAGILYYDQKVWLGISVHRINEPNQSLTGGEDYIPRKFSIHGGAVIPVEAFRNSYGQKKLRVAFNYKEQGEWNQLDIGAYFTIRNIIFGMWYRGLPIKQYRAGIPNNESLILLIGYEAPKRLSFGYSYDISINGLFMESGGAHELSLKLEFIHHKKKRRRVVPCARF